MRAVRLIVVAAFILMSGGSPADASPLHATRNVTIASFAFAPATTTINVGDSVTWTNTDPAAHTATSNTGAFDTGQLAQGQSKTITFTTAGTFAYHCANHPSMTGTIVVQAAATAPPTAPPATPPPATAPPTAPPTTRVTAPPQTPVPTPVPTPTPIATAQPTPSETSAPSATPAASASVVAAVPSAPAPSAPPATSPTEGGPGPLLVAAGAIVIVALIGTALVLLRR